MSFYQALQLDVTTLKQRIKEVEEKKEKRFYFYALIIRDVLLVLFSIIFISVLTALFGNENSSMAVVLFCILLSIRFVDFGYKISHSLIGLFFVFQILLISPVIMQIVSPSTGLLINLISLFIIIITTCDKPEMGNGGLYVFGYVFLAGNSISADVFFQRWLMTMVGYIICAWILYSKHKHKSKDKTIMHVMQTFNIHSEKGQWQLQIVIAMSLLFFIGSLLKFNDRFMWIGFACSSLLSSYPINIHDKLFDRIIGAVIGSSLFGILYMITPAEYMFLFGPIAGLCLGVCADYRYKTIFNCFGALLMASAVYGIKGAILLRIFNNVAGLVFGYVFFHFFQHIFLKKIIKIESSK